MKPLKLRIVEYPHSATSRYVVEGLKIEGKRVRKFFRTKAEAETYVELKTTQIDNEGRKAALEMSHELRVMAMQCSEKLQPYGKTIFEATTFYIDHLKQAERSCSVSKLVEEFAKDKKTDGKSTRYLNDLKSRLKRFSEDFGERLVATITMRETDDWLRDLGLAPQSRNNFRTVLCVLFNYAMARGYCATNPIEKTAKAKVVDKAPKILTVLQTKDLLEKAPAVVVPFLAIGAFAGLRPAEIARLDWNEVELERGWIEIKASKSKTATRRLVKLQPNLKKWLQPHAKANGILTPPNIRHWLEVARSNAGMSEWPANALRHSYASYHLAHFNDAPALALQMGHADTGMIFAHYRELVKPNDAEAYWKIFPQSPEENYSHETAR